MTNDVRRLAIRSSLIVGALSILVFAAVLTWPSSGAAQVSLSGVASDNLAADGVYLQAPRTDDKAVVSSDDAVKETIATRPGAVPREVVLTRLVRANADPKIERLVWAVNLDPATVTTENFGPINPAPGGTVGSPNLQTLYAVSFVDAKTGVEVFYASDAAYK